MQDDVLRHLVPRVPQSRTVATMAAYCLLEGGFLQVQVSPNHGPYSLLPLAGSKLSGLSAVVPLVDCMFAACMHRAEVSCPHRAEMIGRVCNQASPSSRFECYVGGKSGRESHRSGCRVRIREH